VNRERQGALDLFVVISFLHFQIDAIDNINTVAVVVLYYTRRKVNTRRCMNGGQCVRSLNTNDDDDDVTDGRSFTGGDVNTSVFYSPRFR